jgi:predicted adenylyl cyclase CyaB
MPRNIELKARVASLDAVRSTAQKLATRQLGLVHQIDTYFHVPRGRLKLRQIDGQPAQLISYHRSDAAQARASDYRIAPVADAEVLKQALAAFRGIQVVVDKTREVFLYHNVRIHLDQVQGLGTFLEFESVLSDEVDDTAGHAQVEWLCGQFGIAPSDVVPQSYSDLRMATSM